VDVRAAVAHLEEDSAWRWISIVASDLETLKALLSQFPEAGRELDRAGAGAKTLRRLKLRRAPFFAWYSFDPGRGAGVVELYRLFHSRQETPEPRLSL
jgi:plasmid stabilization system protein ParE